MQMINKVSCSQGYEFLLRAGAFQVILQDLLQTKTKNEHGTKITVQLWCGNRPKTFLGSGTLEPFSIFLGYLSSLVLCGGVFHAQFPFAFKCITCANSGAAARLAILCNMTSATELLVNSVRRIKTAGTESSRHAKLTETMERWS